MDNKNLFGQMQNSVNEIPTFAERLFDQMQNVVFGNIQAIHLILVVNTNATFVTNANVYLVTNTNYF